MKIIPFTEILCRGASGSITLSFFIFFRMFRLTFTTVKRKWVFHFYVPVGSEEVITQERSPLPPPYLSLFFKSRILDAGTPDRRKGRNSLEYLFVFIAGSKFENFRLLTSVEKNVATKAESSLVCLLVLFNLKLHKCQLTFLRCSCEVPINYKMSET